MPNGYDGEWLIDQVPYLLDIFEKHGLTTLKPCKVAIQADEHADVQSTCTNGMNPKEIALLLIVKEAQSLAGELNLLSTKTCPDISYPVSRASSLMAVELARGIKISKKC